MAGTGPSEGRADVRLREVTKRFGDVVAVDAIDLDIEAGEFFSLLGPSGCGKTTTLRMIGGFEQPDAGRIELGGVDVSGLPPHRRDVNTVFQSYALFPHLNVFENVAYGLRRRKTEREEIRRRVVDILDVVNLPGFERRRPSQLSGGQQQRVALARALVNRPKLLLLDEPLGALDLKLRKQMQLELKRIQHDVGITFIYVTHDQEEAMTMSDRIAVMRDGRIEQIGAPQETYERPATAFVAGFLGASNLLEGSVEQVGDEERIVVLASGDKVRVPPAVLNGHRGAVRVGVRPEKIHLRQPREERAESGENAIDGRVLDATFVGVSNVYTVETRAGGNVTVYVQNLGGSDAWSAAAGDDVVLAWNPEHTFVVEAEPGGGDREQQ